MSKDLEVLRSLFEHILREEVRAAVRERERRPHRLIEVFIDPSSGQLSCSRIGMFLVTVVLFPACLVLQALGFNLGQAWTSFVALASTLAGIYGLNSAARAFRGGNGDGDAAG